tara:strand:+ start:10312 stop:11712 length:1401 start_codon:yes stop_codon:yes gene_type:complete
MNEDLNINKYPQNNFFANPNEHDKEFFGFFQSAFKLLEDWINSSQINPPVPLNNSFKFSPPLAQGVTNDDLIDDFREIILNSYNPYNPGSIAHLDPPALKASIISDFIAAGLNNNLLASELSPSLTKLEESICNWFSDHLKLPNTSGGIAASGGSISNLMALIIARENSSAKEKNNLVILLTKDSHISFKKCKKIMGLNDRNFHFVDTNNAGEMSLKSLKHSISYLKSIKMIPFVVVATAGTTIRGAIDPLKDIADICKKEDIWLHIDGAIGAVFNFSKQIINKLEGIESCNSITVNPQKLLGISKTSSLLLVSDNTFLHSTFQTGLPYLEEEYSTNNRGELGLQGSRAAEVLKLWIGLRSIGIEGIQSIIDSSLLKKIYFESLLDSQKFNIISGPLHISTLSPVNLTNEESIGWSKKIKSKLLKNNYYLSRPLYKKRYYIRAVFGNPFTEEAHIKEIASILNSSI